MCSCGMLGILSMGIVNAVVLLAGSNALPAPALVALGGCSGHARQVADQRHLAVPAGQPVEHPTQERAVGGARHQRVGHVAVHLVGEDRDLPSTMWRQCSPQDGTHVIVLVYVSPGSCK